MYAAESSGKVSISASEDILTSYVFSLFRYLSSSYLPFKFLECAQNIEGKLLSLASPSLTGMKFWPRFRLPGDTRYREGDVLILLQDATQGNIALLIEAKFKSGLSNHLPQPAIEVARYTAGHQLADEYVGLMEGELISNDGLPGDVARSNVRFVLYVTAHHTFPCEDIVSAIEAVRASGNVDGTPEREIYWLPWWRLYALIDTELKDNVTGYSSGELNLLADTRLALDMRGLRPFNPFQDIIPVKLLESLWSSPTLFTAITAVARYETVMSVPSVINGTSQFGDTRANERC
jgi:hypothetical protein